jgi:hypothetical protein
MVQVQSRRKRRKDPERGKVRKVISDEVISDEVTSDE